MRSNKPRYPMWLVCVISLFITLQGCSVNPATGEQDLVLMSESQEIALGRAGHAEILQEYKQYPDHNLSTYVQKIGERVAKNSHRDDIIYRFTVLDSAEVNAFALPGGYIYITRGILAYLNSEDELAAVLAHEIGHVTARHAVRRHSTATLTGIAGAILASQSGVHGAGDIVNVLGTALVRGYGREHELEADRLGANYLARAGYDPESMIDVVRLLKNQELFEQELARVEQRKPRTYHGLFSTHPDNDQRLQSVIRASKTISPSGNTVKKSRGEFLTMLNGVTYGPASSEGVIRGARFYHQELNFSIEFPARWHINNEPNRVVATSPDNDGLVALTVHERNRRIPPKQFMQDRLNLSRLHSEESIDHDGMQGHTALVRTDTDYGERLARVIVLYYGNRAFVIAGAGKDSGRPYRYDSVILQTAKTFRELQANERSLSAPRKIAVLNYEGESYGALAKRSGLNHLAEAQIRLLNGHYPGGAPAKGDLIKTIE
ncbi:MAG TPA: M48 family metalloprotease [Gammaproteobacteria bacterium]